MALFCAPDEGHSWAPNVQILSALCILVWMDWIGLDVWLLFSLVWLSGCNYGAFFNFFPQGEISVTPLFRINELSVHILVQAKKYYVIHLLKKLGKSTA